MAGLRKTVLLFGAVAMLGLGACGDAAEEEPEQETELIEEGAENPIVAPGNGTGLDTSVTRGAIIMDTVPMRN